MRLITYGLIALLLSAILMLNGCSNIPMEVPQTTNRYAELPDAKPLDAQPLILPERPTMLIEKNAQGDAVATLTARGVNQLNAYKDVAEQNTKALEILIPAHNSLIAQRNILVSSLRLEEDRSNFWAQRYADSENMRRQQFSEFQTELLLHKAAIVLLGIFLVIP